MTEQKAKFGVLVQRGKEQYVIEGKEHPVPPELVPPPPTPGWYCTRSDGYGSIHIWCALTDPRAGGGCAGRFYNLCERGEKHNSSAYIVNFGIVPRGEKPIKIKLGRWELDYTYDGGLDNVYASPGYFEYMIKAWGDVDKFNFYRDCSGNTSIAPNEPFKTYVWDDYAWIEFDPSSVDTGNYTVNVQIKIRPTPSCCNCTFTSLLPFWASWWPVHAACIDRMLEPYKSYDFGTLRIYENKEANFTIRNNINTTLLTDVWIDGPDAPDFDIIEGPKGKFYLWPNNHANIKIRWNPQVLGNQTAKLNISCDNGYWDYCYLLGCSEKPPCEHLYIYPPGSGVQASECSWGELLVGQSETKQFAVRNFHRENQIVNIKLYGDSDFRITDGGGTRELESNLGSEELKTHYVSIEFSPTSPGEKTAYIVLEPCNASMLIKGSGKSAVVFDPWKYDFGAQKTGFCSDTVPFNIKNIGDENAEVSVSIQGGKSKNFELVEGFNDTLYSGSQETVRVRFCPVEEDDLEAYLCAEVKAEGSDYINVTANLCGRGCLRYSTAYIEVNPQEISFGETFVGSESEKDLIIKSVGCYDANFRLEISGDECFSIQPLNTTLTLKQGNTGTFTIKFSPTKSGNFTANILVKGLNCNDAEVTVSGSAISLGEVLKIEPGSHDFDVGVSNWKCSDSKNFTIYNSASETINFTLSIGGKNAADFVVLEGEGDQSLPPNSYINAEVQFCPKSGGGQKEAFLIVEPYSPKAENISAKIMGMALVPCQFNLTPLQYDFGSRLINTCSDEVNFTITHISGNQARLSITLVGDAQHFTITQKPDGLFPIHGSGAIKVKYCPKSAGNHTAYLVITPDICDGFSATLIGRGEEAPVGAPSFKISPFSYDFGEVLQGECSPIKNFTITNEGQAAGHISAQLMGDDPEKFKIVSQVGPNKIPPGGWHSIGVKFCPETTGDFRAQLWINTSWEYGSVPDVVASLKGSGVGGYNAEFTPAELDFGSALVGECSEEKKIRLINTGSENMTVYIQLVDSRNFTITQGAGYHYLTVGEEYPIKAKFCPSQSGDVSTTITAIPKEGEVYPSASLSGKGKEKCAIQIQPSSYNFGEVYIGESSNTKFKIKNTGSGSALLNLSITGVDAESFSIGGNTSFILPSESEVETKISFRPTSEGKKQAFLLAIPDACSFEWSLLSGEGKEKPLCMLNVSPTNIDFGSIPLHSYSPNITVTVVNIDSVETNIYEISLTGNNPEDFDAPTGPAGVVPAGNSIEIPVKFCPSSTGDKSAYLLIKSDNCTIGTTVYLQGEGLESESNPSWDPNPPSKNPSPGRWYALGAVKSTQSPGYGMIISHCPKSNWLACSDKPVYIFYLDHKGCLWMRDVSGILWIYNLYTGRYTYYNIGKGTFPVFALGGTKQGGNKIEICYWIDPGFVVFAEASWENEMWSEISLITSYATDFSEPNMVYWYPPYFFFLNRTSDNRLALWSVYEGLVKAVSLDWSPQYATRTDDERIWVNSENSNILVSFNSELEEEETITFSSSRAFNGLARNSHGDIVAIDTASNELIVLLAEENYSGIHTIWLPQQWFSALSEGASRWEGGYSLFSTNSAPFLSVHIKDFAKGSFSRSKAFGGEINNLNLRGDAGLLSYSTWKWSWKPDTKAIETFLGE